MARIGLLHHVDSQKAERVDAQLIQCRRSDCYCACCRSYHDAFCLSLFSDGANIARRFETHICIESHAPLHLEAYITALRVLALAGQVRCPLRIGTCIAAVILSWRSRTVATRLFAFLRSGHEVSFRVNLLLSSEGSVAWGLCFRSKQRAHSAASFPAQAHLTFHEQPSLSVQFWTRLRMPMN
jgi:hypothetical protein